MTIQEIITHLEKKYNTPTHKALKELYGEPEDHKTIMFLINVVKIQNESICRMQVSINEYEVKFKLISEELEKIMGPDKQKDPYTVHAW